MCKKLCALLLAFVMALFALAPVSALAADAPKQQVVYTQTYRSAWDPYYTNNWYNKTYGPAGYTTYAEGACGILSVVNAVHYMSGRFIDPLWLGDWAYTHGCRPKNNGTTQNFARRFAQEAGAEFSIEYVTSLDGSASSYWASVRDFVLQGMAVVAHTVTRSSGMGHYMALVDYDAATGRYLLLDSAPGAQRATEAGNGVRWATAEELKAKSNYYASTVLRSNSNVTKIILSMPETDLSAGESFSFHVDADAASPYYWLSIREAGTDKEILSQAVAGSGFTTSFLRCGHYYAWCTSSNDVDSNLVDFYVYGSKPTAAVMTASAAEADLGQQIDFTLSSDSYYARYWVALRDPDGNVCLDGWYDGGFSFVPTKSGVYSGYATAHTKEGDLDTARVSVTVSDQVSEQYGDVALTIDDPDVRIGEEFTLRCWSEQPASYYVSVYNALTNEHIDSKSAVNGEYRNTFLSAGHYTAYMSALYENGVSQDSAWIDFFVYGPAPTTATNMVSSKTVTLGDTVTVTTTHDAYYARVYTTVYLNNGDTPYFEGWTETDYTFMPARVGHYTVNRSAYTVDGTAHAGWISFDVVCKTHIWDAGVIKTEPTAAAPGERVYTCAVCGEERTESVEALSAAGVALSAERFVYDGKAHTPSVTVRNAAGKKLTKNVDYTVSIPAGRTDPGTYTYVIAGRGAYAGTVRKSFTVVRHETLDVSRVALSATRYTYDRAAHTPSVTVKNAAGEKLTKNVDYRISLPAGRTAPGTYTYTVTGIGKYEGTVKKSFQIVEVLKSARITLSAESFVYDGKAHTPSVTVKNAAGEKLTKNVDYTVSIPAGRAEKGSYSYVITGIGDYTGAVTKTFTVR